MIFTILAVVGAVALTALIIGAVYLVRSIELGDWERGGPPERDNDGSL